MALPLERLSLLSPEVSEGRGGCSFGVPVIFFSEVALNPEGSTAVELSLLKSKQ